jgi:hypothetical protein
MVSRRIKWLTILAAGALSLFLVRTAFAGDVLEDTIEKTIPLDATGTFSLRTIDGCVEIYGAENNEVKIVALRKAFSLERINKIQVQVEGQGSSVTVNTVGPSQPRWGWSDRSGTVDYIISLPQRARIASLDVPNGEIVIHGMRGASINASLGHGRLTSHNCFCDQTLQVESGGLDLFFDWNELRPIIVNANVTNGNARAVIPGDTSFELHASSEHGRVASDFTEIAERRRGGVSAINETIGPAPFSKLMLHVVHGNIQISEGM